MQDDTKEEIKFSSSLRPSTRSDSVIPLNVEHDLRSETRLRKSVSGSGNFPRCDIWTRKYRQNSPIITSANDFVLVGSLSLHLSAGNPRRYARTIPKEIRIGFSYICSLPLHLRIYAYASVRYTLSSNHPFRFTSSSASPLLILFLSAFCYPFLSFAAVFVLLFVVLFINSVPVSHSTLFFFCTCDIQFHTSPHHPSIHPIHTYIHACFTCLHHPYMFMELVNHKLMLLTIV